MDELFSITTGAGGARRSRRDPGRSPRREHTRSCAYDWGSTRDERATAFPCDRHLPDAEDAYFRALDVKAPPPVTFRWLCQLKVAPYSYDWIDNFGRRSPRHLIPGLEALAVGQRFMTFFELVEFERDRHLTLVLRVPGALAPLGAIAVTYVVLPRAGARSRVVAKLLVRYPWAPLSWPMRWLLPWGDLLMMRKQLVTLKRLAEAQAHTAEPQLRGKIARSALRGSP